MVGIVVGECHTDHEEDRQNRKDENPQAGKSKQCFIKIMIEKRVQKGSVGRKLLSGAKNPLLFSILADIHSPDKKERQNNNNGQNTEQENQKAVVSVDRSAVDLLCLHRSQCGQFAEVYHTEPGNVPEEKKLRRKEGQSFDDLSSEQRTQSHNEIG